MAINRSQIIYDVAQILKNSNVTHIILGLSGGADSVALLRILTECRDIIENLEISIVHCNFHLRGEESDRDMNFCIDLCRSLMINYEVAEFNTLEYCRNQGTSVEMACRELRYDCFRNKLSRFSECRNQSRIAVAHNSDDQAETVLLNLFRGAGIKGLAGMQIDTGEIIRPLLTTSRAEILKYLKSIGQDYIIDSSNLSSDYRRNFIRNEIIPMIETRWPGVKRRLNATATIMRRQDLENSRLDKNYDISGSFLSYDSIKKSESLYWPIFRFVENYGGSPSIAEEIAQTLIKDPENIQSGKYWNISEGMRIVTERDGLHAIRKYSENHVITVDKFNIDADIMDRIRKAPNHELWISLPPEKIEFRHRKDGDRICPLGMNGKSKLVSDVMSDAKLSTQAKESTLLAVSTENGDILWIEGLKRSCKYLISDLDSITYRYTINRDSSDSISQLKNPDNGRQLS